MTKPSEEEDYYWLETAIDVFFYSTEESGKWFVFVDRDEVDDLWEKVKLQLRGRNLGPAAKVSTLLDNPTQKYHQLENGRTHMIICYSRDYEDKEDRMRIANVLREHCGLAGYTLYYKRDVDTFSGVYGDECWYAILDPKQTEEQLNERRAG